MKLSRRDGQKLQWVLLPVLALIILALGLGFWSQQRLQQATLERSAAERQAQAIDQRLRQVRTEEQEIKARTSLFQQLEKSGMMGQEKRLESIELLRDLQTQGGLPSMNYEFGPQRRLTTAAGDPYAFYSSPLRLQLRLVHEADLLNLTQSLQQTAKAMVLVRACHLTRSPETTSLAQLGADCDIEWLTLQRTSGAKVP